MERKVISFSVNDPVVMEILQPKKLNNKMSAYINKAILYYRKHEMGENIEASQSAETSNEIAEIKQMLVHLTDVCSSGAIVAPVQPPSKEIELSANDDSLTQMLLGDIDQYT